jgi:hypothetical protein
MPGEVRVIEKWYRGPTDSAGRQLYPGGITFGLGHTGRAG